MMNSSSSSLAQRPSSVRQVNAFTPPKLQPPVQRFNTQPPRTNGGRGGGSSIRAVNLASTGSTDYELTCKRALRLRIVRTLLFSFVATWSIASTTSYLTAGFHLLPSFASFFSILVGSLLTFAFAVLPTIVLRKSLLSQPEATTTSLLSRISLLLSQPTTHTTTIVFLTCGVIQAFVWAIVTDLSKPEARLGVFASTLKYSFHLNERLILLLLSNISLGIVYASRELLAEAFLPKWPSEILPIPQLLVDRLVWLPFSLTLPVVHSAAFTAVYLTFRRPVFRFILSWFGIIARPHIANFLRRAHFPMDLGLFSRMVVLQSATVLGWEVAKAVLEVYMVQPMIISQTSSSPVRCLLEGITSPSPYFRHHALFELSHLSLTSPPLRKAIFSDLSVNSATGRTLWQEVWRSQMVLLGTSYQKLLARGGTSNPNTSVASASSSVSSSAAATPTATSNGAGSGSPSGGRSLKIKNDPSIFLQQPPSSSTPSFLSSSSSSTSSPAPRPTTTTTTQSSSSSSSSTTVPSIFTQHSLPPPPQPSTLPPAPRRVVPSSSVLFTLLGLAAKIWGVGWGLVPKEQRALVEGQLVGLRRAEGREVGRGTVRRSLGGAGKEECLLAVQTLTSLLTTSLTEDPYGQVQRSIPQTLEALLSFHDALKVFQTEATTGKGLGEVEREEMRLVVIKEVGGVLDATESGIRQIVDTFGEHLSAFKLPVQVLKQLEALVAA